MEGGGRFTVHWERQKHDRDQGRSSRRQRGLNTVPACLIQQRHWLSIKVSVYSKLSWVFLKTMVSELKVSGHNYYFGLACVLEPEIEVPRI